MGFTGVLALIFITLKLLGVISWSWLWVLCPLWIGFALVISILCITAFIAGGFALAWEFLKK